MVRGLRPRDWMRWVVDGGGRTVGDAGAVGHAERVRLTQPRRSHDRGASRTPPLTGGCETKVAACWTTDKALTSHQLCAGCARDIVCVGLWTRGRRTVCIVVKIGHAEQMRLTRPGGHAAAAHRGRCALRAVAKRPLRHMTQCMRFPRAYHWCAGRARGIAYVGLWARGRRTVENVSRIGHAQRLRLKRPGNPATAGRRGRRPLRAAAKRTLRHMT